MASAFPEILIARVIYALATSGDLEGILAEGYTYGQIASVIVYARQSEFLIREGAHLRVTAKGHHFIDSNLNAATRVGGIYRILERDADRIDQIEVYDVYLPSKRSSFFRR